MGGAVQLWAPPRHPAPTRPSFLTPLGAGWCGDFPILFSPRLKDPRVGRPSRPGPPGKSPVLCRVAGTQAPVGGLQDRGEASPSQAQSQRNGRVFPNTALLSRGAPAPAPPGACRLDAPGCHTSTCTRAGVCTLMAHKCCLCALSGHTHGQAAGTHTPSPHATTWSEGPRPAPSLGTFPGVWEEEWETGHESHPALLLLGTTFPGVGDAQGQASAVGAEGGPEEGGLPGSSGGDGLVRTREPGGLDLPPARLCLWLALSRRNQ